MNPWVDVAGWTLVHFLWEGTAIAVIALVFLWLLRDRSPQSRYAVACAALVTMLAAPAITAAVLADDVPASRPQPVTRALEVTMPAPSPDSAPVAIAVVGVRRVISNADVNASGSMSWMPIVVLLWMSGIAVLSMRLAGGLWRITRLHRTSRTASPSVWADAAADIAHTLGLSRVIRVIDTALVDTPTVIGVIRPVILLPIAALSGLSSSQVDAILAHELAHIRRHDFLVNLLQTVAETVLFYHPAVWWLSARIRAEREHCCDAVALSVCGDPVSYAEALVELESWRTAHSNLAMAATGGTLMARVRRLLGAPADDRPRSFGAMVVAGVVAFVVCVAGAYLVAAQPDASPSPRAGDSPRRSRGAAEAGARDPAAWSMIFQHDDSTMRFIGFRGRDLIRFAHQIPEGRVIGGPRWLDEQILPIVVYLAAEPRADEMPGIVRQALEDRLHLQTHVEQRNFPVLALVMAKADRTLGPNLRVSSRPCFDVEKWVAAGQPRDQVATESRRVPTCGGELDSPTGRTQYVAVTMPQFTQELRDYVRGWHVAPPPEIYSTPAIKEIGPTLVAIKTPDVVDRTGLRGRYDVELRAFYPTAALMTRFPFLKNLFEPLGFPSIQSALDEQLGLKLVEAEAPYDVIVIDHAERP
jgi:uncharacterized protein (TIGR03435 family)